MQLRRKDLVMEKQRFMDVNRRDFIMDDVYKNFSSNKVQIIYNKVKEDKNIKEILQKYDNIAIKKDSAEETDKTSADDYINHCIRSYLLGCNIQKQGIAPLEQIKASSLKVMSMPRLTDAVFLNIYKRFSDKDISYFKELRNKFNVSIYGY